MGGVTPRCGGLPVHREVFSSIPGLHPLEAGSTPQVMSSMTPDIAGCPLGAQLALVENHCCSERAPAECKISLQWPGAVAEKILR